MAHPKRKVSKSRRNKRRTHYKASETTLSLCKTNGVVHRRHYAYELEGNIYYRGRLLIADTTPEE